MNETSTTTYNDPNTPATSGTMNPPQRSTKNGIDIRDAMSILAKHAVTKQKEHDDSNSDKTKKNGENVTNCSHSNSAGTDGLKTMGQTIHLLNTNEEAEEDTAEKSDTNNHNNAEQNNEEISILDSKKNKSDKSSAAKALYAELNKHTPSKLLQTLFQIQEQRVQTYAKFNSSLKSVLQTSNISVYIKSCAEITATFSVLSNSVMEIQKIFSERQSCDNSKKNDNPSDFPKKAREQNKSAAKWIRNLQNLERNGLNYTVALHLEQMRLENETKTTSTGSIEEATTTAIGSNTTVRLFQEGIVSLRRKIATCRDGINEILDELRCLSMEMKEDEEAVRF